MDEKADRNHGCARQLPVGEFDDDILGLPPLEPQLPAPWQTSEWICDDGRHVAEMSCGSFSLQAYDAKSEPAVIFEEPQSLCRQHTRLVHASLSPRRPLGVRTLAS